MDRERAIFKTGSTTFYMSSLFFPPEVRHDVYDLYSFVRVADDYVDKIPADVEAFYRLRRKWDRAVRDKDFSTGKELNDTTDERVVKNMLRVAQKYSFDLAWVDAFLNAMQSDLRHTEYRTVENSLTYVYGSAEVVGLMMSAIMGLSDEAHEAARAQGRAMQWINFIRDIDEDNGLGRQYFPSEDLARFELNGLGFECTAKHKEKFNDFIQFQIERYAQWQDEAREGYRYIPKRLRIPLQTASDMYDWTARQIAEDPMIVYREKVKPSKTRLLGGVLKSTAKVAL